MENCPNQSGYSTFAVFVIYLGKPIYNIFFESVANGRVPNAVYDGEVLREVLEAGRLHRRHVQQVCEQMSPIRMGLHYLKLNPAKCF